MSCNIYTYLSRSILQWQVVRCSSLSNTTKVFPNKATSSFQMTFLCTVSLKLSWTNFCFLYLWSTPGPGWEWEVGLTKIKITFVLVSLSPQNSTDCALQFHGIYFFEWGGWSPWSLNTPSLQSANPEALSPTSTRCYRAVPHCIPVYSPMVTASHWWQLKISQSSAKSLKTHIQL